MLVCWTSLRGQRRPPAWFGYRVWHRPVRFSWRSVRESNSPKPGRQPGTSPVGLRSANWYGREDSNLQVSRFATGYPDPLNDARVNWGDRRESNSRGAMHSRTPEPLGHGHKATPQTWLRAGELNATRMAYEASMTPVHLPALKPGADGANRTLVGCLPCNCSHIELHRREMERARRIELR